MLLKVLFLTFCALATAKEFDLGVEQQQQHQQQQSTNTNSTSTTTPSKVQSTTPAPTFDCDFYQSCKTLIVPFFALPDSPYNASSADSIFKVNWPTSASEVKDWCDSLGTLQDCALDWLDSSIISDNGTGVCKGHASYQHHVARLTRGLSAYYRAVCSTESGQKDLLSRILDCYSLEEVKIGFITAAARVYCLAHLNFSEQSMYCCLPLFFRESAFGVYKGHCSAKAGEQAHQLVHQVFAPGFPKFCPDPAASSLTYEQCLSKLPSQQQSNYQTFSKMKLPELLKLIEDTPKL